MRRRKTHDPKNERNFEENKKKKEEKILNQRKKNTQKTNEKKKEIKEDNLNKNERQDNGESRRLKSKERVKSREDIFGNLNNENPKSLKEGQMNQTEAIKNKLEKKNSENIFINKTLKIFNMGGISKITHDTSKQEISLNFVFLIKNSVSQLFIASLPYNPLILISSLVVIEVVWVVNILDLNTRKKALLHRVFFFQKMMEGVIFLILYAEIFIIALQDKPGILMQQILKYCVIVGISVEYLFSFCLFFVSLVKWIREKKNEKDDKKKK